MSTRIAWIDADPLHAEQALQRMAGGWRATALPYPGESGGERALPAQGWDAVVLCLPADATQLPAWALEPCSWPLLLCLSAGQEFLAARALRASLRPAGGDYVLRTEGEDPAPELLRRLGLLLRHGTHDGMAAVRNQLARVYAALASMSQGIFQTGPDGRVDVYNQRVLQLLDLPEELMAGRPTLAELTRLQSQRGDFGRGGDLVDDEGARGYILRGAVEPSPEVYWRRTADGRTLEVRTKTMPDGGLVRTFADVSDYVRVQSELQRSEARFRSLCGLSSDWYWEQDARFRFTGIAGVAARQDARLRAMLGRAIWDTPALNMAPEDWAAHRQRLEARQPFRELELQRMDEGGQPYWIALSGEPILGDAGRLLGYRGVGRNITERKRVESEIERLAFYDPLTSLPNRRLFHDRLQRACTALARSQRHAALLFIDLDNFKDLNDSRGHDVGDRLLTQVAGRLRACLRASDTVARFGGDEFVVLAEGLSRQYATACHDAEKLARKIGAVLSQPYALGGADMDDHLSTPSIGFTLFGHPPPAAEELLKQADFAMYQAKAAGRNTVRLFDPRTLAAMSARSELETELRHGIARGELELHYQPIVDAAGRTLGAEALVRWRHPVRGMVAPGEFIGLAEQTGLILPLGQWVVQSACAQLAAWAHDAATHGLVLSVNVSARQFRQPEFATQVLAALQHSGASARLLRLELTESLLLTDTEEMIAKMEFLRAQGVGFSLDDFGTGYSSLSYLKRLPLGQLKIDRGFVRDVLTDPNDAAIVRTILALAQSLDLSVVAEGVETPGQLDFLQRHGCTAFQGYLFGRPGPVQWIGRPAAAVS